MGDGRHMSRNGGGYPLARLGIVESVLENANDAVIVTEGEPLDEPGPKVVYVNAAFSRMTGYSPEDILGKTPRILQGPETDRAELDRLRGSLSKGEAVRAEILNYRKDGSRFWVEMDIVPVVEDGWPGYWISIQRDTTARRKAEERLRDTEKALRTLLAQHESEMITILEPDGELRYESPAVERALGYRRNGEETGEGLFRNVHPDDAGRLSEALGRALATPGRTPNVEYRVRRADGSWRWFESVGNNMAGDAGVGGVVINSRDVTARKEAEEAVRDSERRFRSLVGNSSEVVKIVGLDGTLRYASPAMKRVLGYEPEDMVGDNVLEYVHPDDLPRVSEETRKAAEKNGVGRNVVEYRFRHADGSWRHIEASGVYLIEDPAINGVLVNARDITPRRETEQKLRDAEERYRALVEQIPAVTYTQAVEHHGVVTYISPQIEDMLGYTPEEWTSDPSLWVSAIHPDDREMVLSEDRRTDETGEPFVVEYRKVRKDGRIIWVRSEAKLARDEEGRPLHWQGIVSDITQRKETEAALREAEERYRTLVEQVPGITYVEDAKTGATLYDSPQIEDLLGYPADISERDPHYWWKIVHPDDLERVRGGEARGAERGKFSLEYRVLAKDGRTLWLRDEAAVMRDEHGTPRFWRGFLFDITERKRAEEALRESEARLSSVTSGAPVILFALDGEGRITLAEGKGLESLGVRPDEHVGCSVFEKWENLPGVHENVRRALRGEEVASTVEIGDLTFDARYSPMRNEAGEVSGVIGVATDITARRNLERELEHRAFHDPLTGLANRSLCADRLSQALRRAERRGSPVALLFMDLDDFKVVNDSLGHDTGDELLIEVAGRLRRCLRPGDTLARFGGDEFVVLLEDTGLEGAVRVAGRVAELLEPPFFLGEKKHERFITASIGISLGVTGERKVEDLLREADLAMYRAKEERKGHYEVFDPEMSARVLGRLEMEDSLRRALDHGEMELHYQPVVSLATGGIVGVEALVRWRHPERGLVHPADFIPLAEETGLIIPLGRWVMKEACRQLREWRETTPEEEEIFVCVNLSARQFRHPSLARDVAEALEKTGVPPEAVYLEITESVAMAETRETDSLAELKRTGAGIMIDDFGTGHSSLSYLKKLPVDFIKIDRAFASGLGDDLADREIVSVIVRLGHALDLRVIAEGIESAEQLLRLRDLGCDYAQGYFFSEPLPAEEVAELLKTASLW